MQSVLKNSQGQPLGLNPSRFLRIHRRILVNAERIHEMHPRRHTSLILQDGSVLPVSRRLNDSVKRFLFKSLKVPMLVLPSVYDAGSVRFESSKATLAQWMPLERSSSSLPITVTPIEDCRAYATEDQPAKLDLVIRNWTTQAIKN